MPKVRDYLPEAEIRALAPTDVVCIPSGMGGAFDVQVMVFGEQIKFRYAYKTDPDGWANYINKIKMSVAQGVGFIYREIAAKKGRTMCDAKGVHEVAGGVCLLCDAKIEKEKAANG